MTPRRISETELNALVDGELAPEERAEVEALLQSAPAEQALARELADLNAALRARYGGEPDRPLPQRAPRLLAQFPRRGPTLAVRQRAFAAALAIAVAAGAAGYIARDMGGADRRQEPNFVANAIGAHRVYVPEVRHPVEVKAGEEHLVRWLNRRVGAPFAAPSLVEHGWKLMGGRLVPDGGQPAAQFMYEDGSGRRLTLYIRKETGTANTAFRFAEREGFGAFYWIDQPLAYALAGRLQREELMGLANLVYAQLEAVASSASGQGASSPAAPPPAPGPAAPGR
jgi:anti-sigma factor RsiW